MNDKPNLVKELTAEETAKLQAAIEAGATHARFTYADGSTLTLSRNSIEA